MNRIILASASPRRKMLLEQIGIEYEVMKSDREEAATKREPQEIVCELAGRKAEDVCARIGSFACPSGERPEAENPEGGRIVVIGADTVVSLDGRVMGKPKDAADAGRMLSLLQGNTHQVYTGVALAFREEKPDTFPAAWEYHSFYEKTDVTVYPMTEQEIADYIASGEPMDKAGAYGIQGSFAAFVKGISGDYNNVVGLPVGRLFQEMKAEKLL